MKKIVSLLAVLMSALSQTGAAPQVAPPPTVRVPRVENFNFASGMDSPAWKESPAYSFMLYVTETDAIGRIPEEGAKVQYLYDDNYLYIRAEFTDSDVMTTAAAHGGPFYAEGDVLEVFIKHEGTPYYWEIYGAPNKLRTRYYYPSKGTLGLPSGFALNDCPVLVDAKVDGTLNRPDDRDRSWTVLLGVPRSELEKNGAKFGPGNKWRLFASRYNYNRFLPAPELSSYPQITGGYHSHEYYAEVEFGK
ncbi:MAG: carbohydrate-binding family 9-like protein [Lentisphaeria bacterium]|nr:carbohydrate-binding family 9-like protein [Lentisphaeria bacterium]